MQLGFFWHMQGAVGGAAAGAAGAGLALTRPIAFATAFMLLVSVVIALFKDIPDVAGDSKVSGLMFTVWAVHVHECNPAREECVARRRPGCRPPLLSPCARRRACAR